MPASVQRIRAILVELLANEQLAVITGVPAARSCIMVSAHR